MQNQLLLEFCFWNEPSPRPGQNILNIHSYKLKVSPGMNQIYKMSSYKLKARAIKYRQENDEAVGGFFSQVGDLYEVHHLWVYKDLQSRDDTKNFLAEGGMGF
ncbi:unnamed protein product [Oncorhynchus mykiss]|uniref:NIPSNAP domain-containing protein n=1 Tax=Oncorhynchus mykiss TaxID=8022 RepID=A0A060X180_ONCMY|nr:unnamed protein product [Oncorhynchus mykiss]